MRERAASCSRQRGSLCPCSARCPPWSCANSLALGRRRAFRRVDGSIDVLTPRPASGFDASGSVLLGGGGSAKCGMAHPASDADLQTDFHRAGESARALRSISPLRRRRPGERRLAVFTGLGVRPEENERLRPPRVMPEHPSRKLADVPRSPFCGANPTPSTRSVRIEGSECVPPTAAVPSAAPRRPVLR